MAKSRKTKSCSAPRAALPRPTISVAISIDLIQQRQIVIAKRQAVLDAESERLDEETSALTLRKQELLREFDNTTR